MMNFSYSDELAQAILQGRVRLVPTDNVSLGGFAGAPAYRVVVDPVLQKPQPATGDDTVDE
jgi:hypothetical protein